MESFTFTDNQIFAILQALEFEKADKLLTIEKVKAAPRLGNENERIIESIQKGVSELDVIITMIGGE